MNCIEKDLSTKDLSTKDQAIVVTEKKKRPPKIPLQPFMFSESSIIEIGVDEAGRGPMMGRVYTAAVILPKDDASFSHHLMKDSKKFTSPKKIQEAAEYIKANCIAYHISYEDERVIDEINILQATQKSMAVSITGVIHKYITSDHWSKTDKLQLLIDGNYFNPYWTMNKQRGIIESVPHVCVVGGDNKFTSIAAASILAKVARDQYIADLCEANPELVEKYSIDSNKGYGSKKHMDGILAHGITIWHRRSFGICKNYV